MSGAKVTFEDWHVWVQTTAFILIATFFVVFTIRALLMKRDKADRMASMPLRQDDAPASNSNAEESDTSDNT